MNTGQTIRTDLRRRRDRYRERLQTELDRWIPLLKGRGAHLILLFGSMASGRAGLFSDADLLVVMPSEKGFLDRTADLHQLLMPRVDLDLVVYTPEEFESIRGRPFVRRALREGRVLHEAAG